MRPDRSGSAIKLTLPAKPSRFPDWWWRRSLRVKIIAWFFVPTALLFIAVAATNFFAYQDVTADLVIERNQDLTRRSASQLSSSLGEFTEALEEVGRTMDASQPPGPSRFPALRTSGALSMFDGGVVVLDTFGMPVASYPPDGDATFEDWSSLQVSPERVNAFLLRLVRSDRPVFSDVLGGRTEDDLTVAVGVPILGPGGELLGATVGMFDVGPTSVSALYARIVRLRLSQGGAVYLVDENGRAIYHSDFWLTGSDLLRRRCGAASPHLRGGRASHHQRGGRGRRGCLCAGARDPVEPRVRGVLVIAHEGQPRLPAVPARATCPRHPRSRRHRRHRHPPSHAPRR